MTGSLLAILTEQTCGEACWRAVEDVCRCSCGGKNHGCLRSENGEQPTRTAKIGGFRYELKGVGYDDVWHAALQINEADGVKYIYAAQSHDPSDNGLRAKLRTATASQIERWPELSAYRDLERWDSKPYLLWVRV